MEHQQAPDRAFAQIELGDQENTQQRQHRRHQRGDAASGNTPAGCAKTQMELGGRLSQRLCQVQCQVLQPCLELCQRIIAALRALCWVATGQLKSRLRRQMPAWICDNVSTS